MRGHSLLSLSASFLPDEMMVRNTCKYGIYIVNYTKVRYIVNVVANLWGRLVGKIGGSLCPKHSWTMDNKTCTTQKSIGKRAIAWDVINNVYPPEGGFSNHTDKSYFMYFINSINVALINKNVTFNYSCCFQ